MPPTAMLHIAGTDAFKIYVCNSQMDQGSSMFLNVHRVQLRAEPSTFNLARITSTREGHMS